MKKRWISAVLAGLALLAGCGGDQMEQYQQITQAQAYQMMQEQQVLILDVREQYEFDAGHIPGAVLLPLGDISEATAARTIGSKDAVVLVYCRSGNRSKQAARILAQLGYTGIYEFGGITTWPYEIE